MLDNIGITLEARWDLMAKRDDGHENLGFVCDDYINYLKIERTNQMRLGDAGNVLEFLHILPKNHSIISILLGLLTLMIPKLCEFCTLVPIFFTFW